MIDSDAGDKGKIEQSRASTPSTRPHEASNSPDNDQGNNECGDGPIVDQVQVNARRSKQDGSPGPHPVILTVPLLSKYYHKNLDYVTRKLGISKTALKAACRRLGIGKWPYAHKGPRRRRNKNAALPFQGNPQFPVGEDLDFTRGAMPGGHLMPGPAGGASFPLADPQGGSNYGYVDGPMLMDGSKGLGWWTSSVSKPAAPSLYPGHFDNSATSAGVQQQLSAPAQSFHPQAAGMPYAPSFAHNPQTFGAQVPPGFRQEAPSAFSQHEEMQFMGGLSAQSVGQQIPQAMNSLGGQPGAGYFQQHAQAGQQFGNFQMQIQPHLQQQQQQLHQAHQMPQHLQAQAGQAQQVPGREISKDDMNWLMLESSSFLTRTPYQPSNPVSV